MYRVLYLHPNKCLWICVTQVHLFARMRFVFQCRIEQDGQALILDEGILPVEFTAQDAEDWLNGAEDEGSHIQELFADLPQATHLVIPQEAS